MVHTSCISLVFFAQKAFWITALFCQFCSRDRLRVLLRFGEVDRDIDIAVGTRYAPADILCDAVSADVVGILAQFVEVIGCSRLRSLTVTAQ